jgi:hypothetical protein
LRWNRQYSVDDVCLIAIEDLDDMAIRLGIEELQYILPWGENRVCNLNSVAYCENCLLVPFIR